MVTPTSRVIARAPWHFRDFRYISMSNVGKDHKKSYLSAGPQWHCAIHGESGRGYCIAFIKRLNEGVMIITFRKKNP